MSAGAESPSDSSVSRPPPAPVELVDELFAVVYGSVYHVYDALELATAEGRAELRFVKVPFGAQGDLYLGHVLGRHRLPLHGVLYRLRKRFADPHDSLLLMTFVAVSTFQTPEKLHYCLPGRYFTISMDIGKELS